MKITDIFFNRNQVGYVGATVRITLEYSDKVDENCPKKLIAKMGNENQMMRSFFAKYRTYEKEVDIYKHYSVGKVEFPVPIAKCFFADINKKDGNNIILLEDLNLRGLRVGDSVLGEYFYLFLIYFHFFYFYLFLFIFIYFYFILFFIFIYFYLFLKIKIKGATKEQVFSVLNYLSVFHAYFWDNLGDKVDWIDLPMREFNRTNSISMMTTVSERFFNYHSEIFPPKLLEKLKNFKVEKFLDILNQRQQHKTLVHGDSHINNVLFSQDCSQVIFVDWQLINYGLCTSDLIYFSVFSCTSEFVNLHFDSMKDSYYNNLVKSAREGSSLSGYSRENFEDDILFSFNLLAYFTILLGSSTAPTNKEEENETVKRAYTIVMNFLNRFINMAEKIGIDKLLL